MNTWIDWTFASSRKQQQMRRFLNRELKWKLIENSFASIWIFREIFDFSRWKRKVGCEFWRKWIFEYFCGVLITITKEFEGNWTYSNALKILKSSEKRAKIVLKIFPKKKLGNKTIFHKKILSYFSQSHPNNSKIPFDMPTEK